jgi:mannose/fructose-specific phosphotransferase system component IIA
VTLRVAVTLCGEEHECTIIAGTNYAIALDQAHRAKEACDLFTKILATSKQVFGHHHNLTKDIESALELANDFKRCNCTSQ